MNKKRVADDLQKRKSNESSGYFFQTEQGYRNIDTQIKGGYGQRNSQMAADQMQQTRQTHHPARKEICLLDQCIIGNSHNQRRQNRSGCRQKILFSEFQLHRQTPHQIQVR